MYSYHILICIIFWVLYQDVIFWYCQSHYGICFFYNNYNFSVIIIISFCCNSTITFCLQAAAMLTCEICGGELLLEDMKTHFLLNHREHDMSCPLCSLSGVTFDELCLHINSAHPDKSPVSPSSGFLLSPDYEAAKTVSDSSCWAAGETKEVPDPQSSAGEAALVTSELTTHSTEASFGRERTEDDDDDDTEGTLSLPRGH